MQEEYRSIIGKVLYLVKKVEPTCANAVRELSSFLDNPSQNHWRSVMRLVGYLGAYSRPLKMRPPVDLTIRGCVDSDWASDPNDRKSVTGFLITIGNCLVDWSSRKQATIALSSTEAEYMAYSDAGGTIKYLHMLITEVCGDCPKPAVLHEDNTGAIHLVNNNHIGKRTKHIDIKYRFVNSLVKEGLLKAEFIRSEDNASDIMTKHLVEKLFVKHADDIYNGVLFQGIGRAPNKEDVEENKDSGLKNGQLGLKVGVGDEQRTGLACPNLTQDQKSLEKAQSAANLIDQDWTQVGESLSNQVEMTEGKVCLALQPTVYDWVLVEKRTRPRKSV